MGVGYSDWEVKMRKVLSKHALTERPAWDKLNNTGLFRAASFCGAISRDMMRTLEPVVIFEGLSATIARTMMPIHLNRPRDLLNKTISTLI